MQPGATERIARNTLLLYLRQILVIVVSLYSVRVVLRVLGIEDYGIYNVAVSVVALFKFLSGSMATAAQRFFSFELGRKDHERLRRTFCLVLMIQVMIAVIVILAAETGGVWFLVHRVVLPVERLPAALWVFQCSLASFLASLIAVPYLAVIIAREKMEVYTFVSMLEAVLNLAAVQMLRLFSMDALVLYGILMLLVSLVVSSAYISVCLKCYPESRFHFDWDPGLFASILGFMGWNLFGAGAGVAKNQAINLLLNMRFGPMVNAARGIAAQVNGAVISFSQNFTTAVRPQIIKHYALDEHEVMLRLVFRSSRISGVLMLCFVLPLYLEMPLVMRLWLQQTPPYVVAFTRLVLLDAMIDSISYPLMTAAQATGRIRLYQSVVGGILLLNFPVSYLALHFGCPAESVLVIAIIIAVLALLARLVILHRLLHFSVSRYFMETLVRVVLVCALAVLPPLAVSYWVDEGLFRGCLTLVVSTMSILVLVLTIGVTNEERSMLSGIIRKGNH